MCASLSLHVSCEFAVGSLFFRLICFYPIHFFQFYFMLLYSFFFIFVIFFLFLDACLLSSGKERERKRGVDMGKWKDRKMWEELEEKNGNQNILYKKFYF